MDVSADLTELGRTPIAVVSAGVKSILDIGRTLEYLETEGVTVGNFGSSKDFPAFFSRKSGFQVLLFYILCRLYYIAPFFSVHGTSNLQHKLPKCYVSSIPWSLVLANVIIDAQDRLRLSSGALIGCPIPVEYEEAGLRIQSSVEQAIRESEEYGVNKKGKDVTPWLLWRVAELTGGASIPNSKSCQIVFPYTF